MGNSRALGIPTIFCGYNGCKNTPFEPLALESSQNLTRIHSGTWSRLYGWIMGGLYKSYTGLETRVESRSGFCQSQAE